MRLEPRQASWRCLDAEQCYGRLELAPPDNARENGNYAGIWRSQKRAIKLALCSTRICRHIAGPPTKAEIQKAVGARLACAMHEDWRAAIGQHSKTDGATQSARPMTTTEFNRRWAAVCDIIEGRCVPRPDRINSHRAEN